MKNMMVRFGIFMLIMLLLAACGKDSSAGKEKQGNSTDEEEKMNETIEVDYLGEKYTVLKDPSMVITGSLEAMEDALILGVEPAGGVTVGGDFPKMFSGITGSTQSIGEKTQPSFEKILALKPDVILSSTKFPDGVGTKLKEIATTIPVSHIATNWKDNLLLMGELSGKKEKAKEIINQYEKDIAAVKEKTTKELGDKSVVLVRIRSGNIMIYGKDLYYNSLLYDDLGLKIPKPIQSAKKQEAISLEKFSEMNPDYIFVEFSEGENAEQPDALKDLKRNPIWNSLKAVKNDHVFVNIVDPLAQGGTAWSKMQFLKGFQKSVLNK